MWEAVLVEGTLDDDKADERFALVAAAAMNGPHFMKQGKRAYEPLDFLPKRRAARDAVSSDIRAFFMNRRK